MADDATNFNIVLCGINRFNGMVISVIAAEIKALTLSLDFSFVIKHLIEEIIGKKIKIEKLLESNTLLNVVARG